MDKKQERLKLAQQHAESKGGKCLSEDYVSTKTKMLWKCSNPEHDPWLALYDNVISKNKWCPECVGRSSPEKKLLKSQQHAENRGGKCLSNKYEGAFEKMEWKCSNPKHPIWESSYNTIVNKFSWCPQCGIEKNTMNSKLKNGLQLAQQLAIQKQGSCLSTIYVNNNTKMEWKCSNPEHPIWEAHYNNIKNGKWCPVCAKNTFYKENKVRKIFNYIFDIEFKRTYLDWNINPKTGKKLELDGYNEQLLIAFEFQGVQHYKEKSFNQTKKVLEELKYRDAVKVENCKNNKVKLIIINDEFENTSNKYLIDLVINILLEEKININKTINYEYLNIELNKMTSFQEEGLIKAQEYAKSRNGKCISKEYVDRRTPLEWKCENKNHPSWFRDMSAVYNNAWCQRCAAEIRIKKIKNKSLTISIR